MADITQEQFKQAIINAENAGKTEDVKRLVAEYVSVYGTGEPRKVPPQPSLGDLGESKDIPKVERVPIADAIKQYFSIDRIKKDLYGIGEGTYLPTPKGSIPQAPTLEELDEAATKELKDLREYRGGFGGIVRALLYPDVKERAMLFADEGFDVDISGPYPTITSQVSGEEFALNSPGWSLQDAISLAGEIATFTPAGRFTSVGRTLGKKVARGIVSGATTSGVREAVQVAGGGEFDGDQILFDTIATSGGGALEKIAPSIWRKLSPAAKKKAQTLRSITALIDIGVDIDELKRIASREIIDPSSALE